MREVFEKIFYLLNSEERKATIAMLFLMLVGMVVEMLGIGLVIPVVTLMIEGDGLTKFPVIAAWAETMQATSQTSMIAFAMMALVAVYLLKNIYLAFLVWKQASFALNVQAGLSKRMFNLYLKQPYTFHLQRNSAQLIRNIGSEVSNLAGMVSSLQVLLTEVFVLVGVAALILLIEPVGALAIVVVLSGSAFVFHRLTRGKISDWGGERQYHEGRRLQYLQEGLSGVKDVKLLGREKEFLRRFNYHNLESIRVWRFHTTLQGMPRLIFELLAVTGLAILVITMLDQGRDVSNLVPVLGMFAASAFRLMPSVNRMLGAIQTVRYNMPSLNHLYDENRFRVSALATVTDSSQAEFQRDIRIEDVSFAYPSSGPRALSRVSIAVSKGELVGLIGTSGSGKTTLVDIFMGLLPPSEGRVLVDGIDIQSCLRGWQDQIGYVPQSIYLTDDTLRRNVAFGLADDEINEAAILKAIEAAQLKEFVETLPDGLDTVVGERGVRLSGGQRQRIGIARALYHAPSVLVFDEATSALDVATETSVMEVISALKGTRTMILVAHRLSTVERCDRLFKFEKGRLVASGSPDELLHYPESRRRSKV